MSKSFTLSKMSFKDIVIAVLVLYITYKLVDGTGVEPAVPVPKACNRLSRILPPL